MNGTGSGGGGAGSPTGTSATIIGQSGVETVIQTSAAQWHSVAFDATITNPVIKMSNMTNNDGDPYCVRVRNVSDNGFEWQIDEWDYLDGSRILSEEVSWLAIAEGTHTLDNGSVIQAGLTTAINEANKQVTFGSAFGSVPVVMSQVMTSNEIDAVVTRNRNRTTAGFQLRMQEQELNSNSHATETIGWIAIDNGGSVTDGIIIGETSNSVNHNPATVAFGGTFANAPTVLHDQQTFNGGDASWTQVNGVTTNDFIVSIDEEQSKDTETNHTTEIVGFYALSEELLTAQGNGANTLSGGDGGSGIVIIKYAIGVDGSAGLTDTFAVGSTEILWTAIDLSGNTATCSQIVTVTDDEDPTITCAADQSQTADPGMCNAAVSVVAPVTADNCAVASVINDFNGTADASDNYPVGTTTVVWTVTDASGNTATCSQDITVNDNENPTITCAADVSVSTDSGLCSADVTIPAPVSNDNCEGSSVFYSVDGDEATGGTVTTYSEGGVLYRVHTFTNSGTFNLPTDQEIEYLVVGGGGAGRSGFNGGGGGAGGVQTGNMILSSQAYTITVGNGGVGSTENGGNGESSSINGIITAGGGFGATDSNGAGAASGSSQSNSG
ncbi:MAG: HYR domain-containing protein, partial [Saccharospirillaceae bacterium]|nr:HYR domain-containing protein [Saccharospirillaceae bacterium]